MTRKESRRLTKGTFTVNSKSSFINEMRVHVSFPQFSNLKNQLSRKSLATISGIQF